MRWLALLACYVALQGRAIDSVDIPEQWMGSSVSVRLTTGDVLRGELLMRTYRDTIQAIKLRTAVGTATIDLDQIAEIRPLEKFYRHAWRGLLVPTAEPIGTDHSIMSMELLTLGAGIGIGNVGSIMLLRSIVPGIPAAHQISLVNAKATLLQADYQQLDGHLSLCVGGNLAWINSPNRLQHLWFAGTFTRVRSRLTVVAFYNLSDRDVYQISAGTFGSVAMRYAPNAVGFALGLDVQLPARDDMHVLAELWNLDLTRPYQTLGVLGVRLANTALALDAGIAVGSLSVVIPLVAASWTPW
jgi:hypothetical protein